MASRRGFTECFGCRPPPGLPVVLQPAASLTGARLLARPAAVAASPGWPLPHLLRLPRQHLPLPDSRGGAARSGNQGRPGRRGGGGQRGDRRLARRSADARRLAKAARPGRLRRRVAPRPPVQPVLAAGPRPGPRHGRRQPARPARHGAPGGPGQDQALRRGRRPRRPGRPRPVLRFRRRLRPRPHPHGNRHGQPRRPAEDGGVRRAARRPRLVPRSAARRGRVAA